MKLLLQVLMVIMVIVGLYLALSYAMGLLLWIGLTAAIIGIIVAVIRHLARKRRNTLAPDLKAQHRAEIEAERILKDLESRTKSS